MPSDFSWLCICTLSNVLSVTFTVLWITDMPPSPHPPQATELFLRAVQEEQNGAVYEGVYVGLMVINKCCQERIKCNVN